MSRSLRASVAMLMLLVLSAAAVASPRSWPVPSAGGSDRLQPLDGDWSTAEIAHFRLQIAGRDVLAASRLIVDTQRATPDPQLLARANGYEPLLHYRAGGAGHHLGVYRFDRLGQALQQLDDWQAQPDAWRARGVQAVELDLLPTPPERQDNPLALPLRWRGQPFSLADYLDLAEYRPQADGRGVRLALIDDGVFTDAPMFAAVDRIDRFDADSGHADSRPDRGWSHGSMLASILWGFEQPRWQGIAPGASMIAIRMTAPWTSNLLRAFARAERDHADVINCSWLLPWVAQPLHDYLAYLTRDARDGTGIAVVVAAGREFRPGIGLAAEPEVIVVSAVDYDDRLANAGWDRHTDIAAVGFVEAYAFGRGEPRVFGKTSVAAPVVSGTIALLRQLHPALSVVEIEQALRETAHIRQVPGPDARPVRYRTLDARALLQRIRATTLVRATGAGEAAR